MEPPDDRIQDEDGATSNTQAISYAQRRTALRRRRKAIPVDQISDAIEHAVVTGAKLRRDQWRREQHLKQTEENNKKADNDDNESRVDKEPKMIHAEDRRIYESSSSSAAAARNSMFDAEWNVEHGDGIMPVLFYWQRLSQREPPQQELLLGRDTSAGLDVPSSWTESSSVRTTASASTTTNKLDDVPRALLLRCWERAVHAASNSICAPVADAAPSEASPPIMSNGTGSVLPPPHSQPHYQKFDPLTTPIPHENVIRKCQSLGIHLANSAIKSTALDQPGVVVVAVTCPRCSRTFSSEQDCSDHYYGNQEQLGCCRPLLRERYLRLIDQILQHGIQSQTDKLFRLLAATNQGENTNGSNNHTNDENSSSRQWDWQQVHGRLETALDSAVLVEELSTAPIADGESGVDMNAPNEQQQQRQTPRCHPVLEGLKLSENDKEMPLVVNSMVLEAVNRRLIDRYAQVPP